VKPIRSANDREGTWPPEGLIDDQLTALNISGNRESTSPGIGLKVEAFLGRVIQRRAGESLERVISGGQSGAGFTEEPIIQMFYLKIF
jgi:hypothetical protein